MTNVGSEFIAVAPTSAASARYQEPEHNGSCEDNKPVLHSFQFWHSFALCWALCPPAIGCGGRAQTFRITGFADLLRIQFLLRIQLRRRRCTEAQRKKAVTLAGNGLCSSEA